MLSVGAKIIRGLKTCWLENQHASFASPERPLLFFLHGFPDDAKVWENQLEYFGQNYPVIAPFGRGTRNSQNSPDPKRYGPESVLLDHLEILQRVDPKRQRKVVVIGHDIGSIYAWNLARALKGRCCGLIILNGASLEQMSERLKNVRQVLKSWYIFAMQLPGAIRLWRRFEAPLVLLAHKKGGLERPKELPSGLEQGIYHYRQATRAGLVYLLKGKKAPQKLPAPVLILCSKGDPYLVDTSLDEAEKLAVNPTVRYMEGGHWAQAQNPQKFNLLMQKFLENQICPSPKK